jgi:hypothetical protein
MYKSIKTAIKPLFKDEETYKKVKAAIKETLAGKTKASMSKEDKDQALSNLLDELIDAIKNTEFTVVKRINELHPEGTIISFIGEEEGEGLNTYLRGNSTNPAVGSDIWNIDWICENLESGKLECLDKQQIVKLYNEYEDIENESEESEESIEAQMKGEPMFLLLDVEKNVEEDTQAGGADPDTRQHIFNKPVNKRFPTAKAMVEYLAKEFGLHNGMGDFIAFEDGRLVSSQLENTEGFQMSKSEMEKWEKGEIKGYAADYDIYFSIIEEKTPTVDEMVKLGFEQY